jgi:hypothetical protein
MALFHIKDSPSHSPLRLWLRKKSLREEKIFYKFEGNDNFSNYVAKLEKMVQIFQVFPYVGTSGGSQYHS